MKVVLIKDVRKMGSAGQVIEVSDGHAINFLFPRKLAVTATAQAVKHAETRAKQNADQKAMEAQVLKTKLAALADTSVVIKKKANDKGHLYDGVGADDIAAATGLPEDAIAIEKPFKEVGTYEVPVSAGEAFGSFSIVIEAE